jgi:peptidoglycan biosynthesis protein MviN/MurJ (putative lipid II flippase)
MTEAFYDYNENKYKDRIVWEALSLSICGIVSLIGLFIITNKNLKSHPYPMIAYAIIASAAYIASYSKTYWFINSWILKKSENKESPIVKLFIWCWAYLLKMLDSKFV